MDRRRIDSLELRGVSYWYDQAKPVFNGASATFLSDHVIHIQGPAATGKSTVLKLIAGLLNPSDGQILVNQQPVQEMSFEDFLPLRLSMGYSFDMGGLLNNRTIIDNLKLPLEYHRLMTPDVIESHIRHYLERFQLATSALLRPSAISGSKRKATVVARSLVLNPDVLLLDDPTTGLSSETRSVLIEEIQALRKQKKAKFVVVVSEDRPFVRELVRCGYGLQELAIESNTLTLCSAQRSGKVEVA